MAAVQEASVRVSLQILPSSKRSAGSGEDRKAGRTVYKSPDMVKHTHTHTQSRIALGGVSAG